MEEPYAVQGEGGTNLALHARRLQNADFSGANIGQTSFVSSDLRGVDFSGTRTDEAYYSYADVTGADFSDSWWEWKPPYNALGAP